MSITINDSEDAIMIAKVEKTDQIIYYKPNDEIYEPLCKKNNKCPNCGKIIKFGNQISHIVSCPKKKNICSKFESFDKIIQIPQEQGEIIYVTGPPKAGKTYWINQYAKAFKNIYNKDIYLFTRNEHDETLDDKLYNKILIDDLDEKIDINTFSDSLVIFDDIESSVDPKTTSYLFSLLNDLIKNGRHLNDGGCSIIFSNQQMRLYLRTRVILECCTNIIIFPKYGSKYHMTNVLKLYLGLSQREINYIFDLPSRWVSIQRMCPKYVISEHIVYMLGCEYY